MIKCLLQVDPKNRPTTKQILQMPILINRCNRQLKDVEVVDIDSYTPGEDIMLGTIRVPKNLRLLSERLPKSNYGGANEKSAKKQQGIISSKIESSASSTSVAPTKAQELGVPSTSDLLAMAIPQKS